MKNKSIISAITAFLVFAVVGVAHAQTVDKWLSGWPGLGKETNQYTCQAGVVNADPSYTEP